MSVERRRGAAGGLAPCPICRKPHDPEFRPFCSRGCRDRDLLGWMSEGYRIPTRSTNEDELVQSSDHGAGED